MTTLAGRMPRARNRASIAFVLAVVLTGGGLVSAFGASAGSALLNLQDSGAWLVSNLKGWVTHVNGASGQADADAKGFPVGHGLTVNQDGVSVLVTDPVTGRVTRIDPASLTSAQSNDFGRDAFIVAHGDVTYVVSHKSGTITRVDPVALTAVGAPVTLQTYISGGGFAADGTAWFALPSKGQLVPVVGGRLGTAVTVARPGADLTMTVAGGDPVAVDARTGTLIPIRSVNGVGHALAPLRLPAAAVGQPLVVSDHFDGTVIPIAVSGTSTLLIVDIARRTVRTVQLPAGQRSSDRLGAPVINGGRIYIPGDGKVLVYDTGSRAFDTPITLSERGALTVFVHNGAVWINNPETSEAKVVRPTSPAKTIDKYDPNAAVAPSKTTKNAAPRIIVVPVTKYRPALTTTTTTTTTAKPDRRNTVVQPPPIAPPVTSPALQDPIPDAEPDVGPLPDPGPTTPPPSASCFLFNVTPSPLPPATLGVAYSVQLHVVGADPASGWRVFFGALPAGLDLSPSGILSGTPTIEGTSKTFGLTNDAVEPICGALGGVSQQITVTRRTGDINGDGFVNCADEDIMRQNYGRSGMTVTDGDLNGDGAINYLDLGILASNLDKNSGTCASSTPGAPAQAPA